MVFQAYDVYVEMEHVILGNDALFKCKIPSYVADLAEVSGWLDSEGNEYLHTKFGKSLETNSATAKYFILST